MRFTSPIVNPVNGKLTPVFNGGSITKWLEINDVSTRSLSIPLTGADTGTDMFRVNTTNKRAGVFTSDLTLANALFQVGQGEALTVGVQATCAFFGSGQSYIIQRDTINNVEFLTGVDSTGGIFSVTTNHPLQFRWGSGAVGNVNYMTGLLGGELAMRGVSNGIGWYNGNDLETNYEKFQISWGGDEALLYVSRNGTGVLRNIRIGEPNAYLRFDAATSAFKFIAGQAPNTRHVTTASDNVLITDGSLRVDRTGTSTVALALPSISSVVDGFRLDIIDTGYNASANNITISPDGSDTINNAGAAITIATDGGVRRLEADATNTNWIIL